MKKILFFIIMVLGAFTSNAELPNIVALVNNDPITLNEFKARKHMVMALNNIETLNKAEEQQLNNVALKSLIEEALLFQFSKQNVSDEEINEAIKSIEERNKMPAGHLIQYLKSKSVDITSFKTQIKSELVKMNIMSSFSRSVNVSSKEIDAIILSSNQKDAQIIAQIFTSKNKDDKTLTIMYNLQKQLKNCLGIKESLYKDFATIQKIDEKLSNLDKTSQTIIKDLNINQASSVFEMSDGFKLILVCEKKILNFSSDENSYVVNFLTNKKISQKAQKFFEDLRKKAYIKIMLPT